ncbi:chromate transporter, chromate ion transporter (CHR) family [Thermaerobacter marianensis DSM 12885]|uniref:Chromate transporter, chromate ion transporter (CHR) family n=1 Tax=Thermaerobacter marianensis (strain ATCC 700841 / DSM 12885 / JCM 10246 / 7p75a) TaxID=644966 RepID=E6SM35_THEM7|nr:chromate efflux transporter [Thermaerobacter marianensis]ADU50365.1 chromate transporter, chromate ion transporter (CHR) family [Thermaerobacter marianensis DSM 12885]
MHRSTLGEVVAVFFRLGVLAFGGPAAHIAMMQDELVRRRRWLDEQRFLDLLSITHLIPGPNSTELAMHLGMERAGWRGWLAAGACFILPAALMVGVLAHLYAVYGRAPVAVRFLEGVLPVVLAIVVQALWGLGRTVFRAPEPGAAEGTGRPRPAAALAARAGLAVTALALYWAGVHELLLLLAAAVAWGGAAAVARRRRRGLSAMAMVAGALGTAGLAGAGVTRLAEAAGAAGSAGSARFPGAAAAGGSLDAASLAAAAGATGSGSLAVLAAAAPAVPFSLSTLFLTFLKIGSVLYGSGYVLLAFLRRDFVERLGWLTDRQLLDAIAVGQFTPGPVFTTATFVGYLTGGWAGAAVATAGIFLPSFVFVAAIRPLADRLRRSPVLAAALDGLNVASLALMAGVTWQLARTAVFNLWTAGLFAAALVILGRTRLNSAWLIAAGAVIGLLMPR